ncbi:MAG: hypothetical protein HY834_15815 [Devosia nanyangense]|uniref:Uncharacterized protein n=1 Tax=Devosia nanyangense TaxID=1228055 RepID=A0A933L5C9_9HYPH|nr:hypothetical protein [Devosia nanyangense]
MAERRGRGLEEAQSPFAVQAVELSAVFAAYGVRCAFTGADLRREAEVDPLGTLLRLDPAGDLSPGNCIPACADAIWAYERGHLAIGSRFEFLVALDIVSPEFLERLNPLGRLNLPADPAFTPNRETLATHRRAFAEGLIS